MLDQNARKNWTVETSAYKVSEGNKDIVSGLEAIHVIIRQRITFSGWRDGSIVKSTFCFSRRPEFSSQNPCNFSSRRPNVLFCPWAPAFMWRAHTHTYKQMKENDEWNRKILKPCGSARTVVGV